MIINITIASALLSIIGWRTFPQDVTFEASIDKNPVGKGEQFSLSLVLSNPGMGGGKNFQPPDLSKFFILAGPNQSTSMQFVNGAMSSSLTYTYMLQPKELGKHTIGSASIEVAGNVYKTKPLALDVVAGSPRPKPQADSQDDLRTQIADNLFLRAVVDKHHVMQGEQINLVFKLYTRLAVSDYTVEKHPSMVGFWSEEVETAKQIALNTETFEGKQYQVGVVKRLALFPTQSGTLEISPMEMQTALRIQDRRSLDPFDAFFRDPFGRRVNYAVRSDLVKIKVDPLPPGAPAGFKGAVGRFTMNTSVDKTTTKTNEPVSLKVTIAGSGNIKLLESPVVEIPADFEQYTPKVNESVNRQGERISGSKTFEYLIIPRYPGEKTIKPVTFVYFDLGRRQYISLRSEAIELNVDQGAASGAPFASGPRGDVRLLTEDIRFIKVTQSGFSRKDQYFHTSTAFIMLLLLPLMALAGAFVYSRQRQAVMRDEVGYRNRRAIKVAQKGLKQAELLLKEVTASKVKNSSERKLQFYAEISRAMWKYLGDKLNISQAGMSIDVAVSELERRSVNGEVSLTLRSLLESCDMARFAPTSLETVVLQKTYEDARRLIVELERKLKA